MSQSITNWFASTTKKSTAAPTQKKKSNNKKRSARKRKRNDDDDEEYQPVESSTVNKKNNSNHKRRKLNNTKKPQKNSLLSFVSKTKNVETPKIQKTTDKESDKVSAEKVATNSASRYGRKRKKVNYSLTSLWGLPPPKNDALPPDDEEYKVESDAVDEDTNQHTSDEEYMMGEDKKPNRKSTKRSTTKRKGKNKAKSKRKNSKAKVENVTDGKQKELTDTFFMSKAERRQYKREQVMTQFAEQLARRNVEDKKLFGGKKINPFFEMTKNRKKLAQNNTKEDSWQTIEAPLFPKICSVQPPSTPNPQPRTVYTTNHEMYIMDHEFDIEMEQIETQIADLLYCTTHDDNAVPHNVMKPMPIDLTTDEDEELNDSTKETTYWPSQQALDSYCGSSSFQTIIRQISRAFPNMDHKIIQDELCMCLYRSIEDKNHRHILWCDKYKPSKAVEVVGNWFTANELKSWLKAWSNAEEKQSYLVNSNYALSDDEYCFSDEYEVEEKDLTLSNISLLTGPTACGKTAAVYAVANELQYTVIEVNCTTIKTGKDLNDQIGEATQSQQVKSTCVRSMVLLEEVDNMLESAPSIVRSITNFVKTSRCPMILTAQHIPPSLANLKLKHFEFKYGSLDRLALRTHIIALSEGICVTRKEIEAIILFFDYDVRCVWSHLQFWLHSVRTFTHFNGAQKESKMYLPLSMNVDPTDDDVDSNKLHKFCIYQRVIGCADISYNSCNGKDRLFWSHFVESFGSLDKEQNAHEAKDNLYCCIQHVLDNPYTHDIVFNSFPFWFMNDISLDAIQAPLCYETSLCRNSNPFRYLWTETEPKRAAQSVIKSLINNVCGDDVEHVEDIEMKTDNKQKIKLDINSTKHNTEWLQDWCLMIDTLSNNDILEIPRGSCVNTSYHDRLRPHTMDIVDNAIDLTWETVQYEENETNAKCQIYDTIQHQYLKQHIAPYLVTLAVTLRNDKKHNDEDTSSKFEAQFTENWIEKQKAHRLNQQAIASSFRQHPAEGNFDFPSSRAWFDHYHEFIATVCVNEHHREKKGGSQYRHGRAIRRSRRNQHTFFQHILEGFLTKHEAKHIVNQWILKFDGMGWERNTLPTL